MWFFNLLLYSHKSQEAASFPHYTKEYLTTAIPINFNKLILADKNGSIRVILTSYYLNNERNLNNLPEKPDMSTSVLSCECD